MYQLAGMVRCVYSDHTGDPFWIAWHRCVYSDHTGDPFFIGGSVSAGSGEGEDNIKNIGPGERGVGVGPLSSLGLGPFGPSASAPTREK